MKLSQLVTYLNHLDNHDSIRISSEYVTLSRYLDDVVHLVAAQDIKFPGVDQRMASSKSQIDQSLQDFNSAIDQLKKIIQSNIEIWEPAYFQSSHKLHLRQQGFTDEQILSRHILLDESKREYVNSRLAMYGDWHHAGAVIRPGKENFLQKMVALDPLYVCDANHNLMTASLSHFPPEYQNRVRRCVIADSAYDASTQLNLNQINKIPHGQIGTILIYNYFNHKPLDFILSCFYTISMWLKPGGTVLFTFNNCDHASAVELVEKEAACYTPGRLLLSGIEKAGLQIVHTYDLNSAVTWVEAKKPGTLTSMRAGQSLARTVAKATRTQ